MAQDGYGTEFRKQFENLTTVERVAEPALKGRKVYDTDLDRIFVGDGTNWNEIPNAGDLGIDYLEKNFLSNIIPATANTSLTDNDNTNPLGLKFSDLRYQAGRTRIEAYSVELTDEYIDNKPTYKIAAGCGPKGFRNQVRFVGQGWQNQVTTLGTFVKSTEAGDYVLVTGLMDDCSMLAVVSPSKADDINVEVDGVDTGTNLSLVGSTALNTYNIRSNTIISDSSISSAISSYGLHTIKFEIGSGGSYTDMGVQGFELITTTAAEQAGKAFVGINETDFVQQTVTDPIITGTKGGKAIRYIDPTDSTRKWATQEPDSVADISVTAQFNTGTNSITVDDSSNYSIDDMILVHSDDAGYIISELFVVASIGGATNITTVANSSAVDRTGAGYNFPIGSTIEHYGKCDYSGLGTAVDHSNEVIARSSHPRRFGAGHTNDWQDLTTSADARSFVLDDGTTSLWGNDVILRQETSQQVTQFGTYMDDGTSNRISFIFNGTGVDLDFNTDSTFNSDIDIYLDGVKIYDYTLTTTGERKRIKLASGLPVGTHHLLIHQMTSAAGQNSQILVKLIEYEPKESATTSSLNVGNLIAKKCILADYVFNSATGLDSFSKGCNYYSPNRSVKLTDSSTAWALSENVAYNYYTGLVGRYNTTDAILEYWFYGTGFETVIRRGTDAGIHTLELDSSTDFSSYDTHETRSAFTDSTGVLDGYAASSDNYKLGVTGLTIGWHKLKITQDNSKNGASSDYYVRLLALGVIGGSPCITEPTQTLQQISSCNVGDSLDLRIVKPIENEEYISNYATTRQITSSDTITNTNFQAVTDMSVTIKSTGNPLLINYNMITANSGAANEISTLSIDGIEDPAYINLQNNGGYEVCQAKNKIIQLPAGLHTITIVLKVSGGGTDTITYRELSVTELAGTKNENGGR